MFNTPRLVHTEQEYYEPKHRADRTPGEPYDPIHEGLHKGNWSEEFTSEYDPVSGIYTINSGGYITEVHEDDIEPVTGSDKLHNDSEYTRDNLNHGSLVGTAIDLSM